MKRFEQHKYILIFTIVGLLISPLLYFGFRRTVKLTDFEIRTFNQNIGNQYGIDGLFRELFPNVF